MGQTRTSKLLAAKRPHLISIQDSVVEKAFGKSGSADPGPICVISSKRIQSL
ncbi:DUF6308 family protein [Timonella senegalensis]|uniref:DUF6308 family protein n=1 Tax=Timonella senegalensis TaxID=1465825 RepID=UPI003898FFB8